MKLISILLSLLCLTPAFCLDTAEPKTDPLAAALTSSKWSWENTDGGKKSIESIEFFRGGFAKNSRFFTARWEATGPRSFVLHNTNLGTPQNGKRAYLVFDAAFAHFIGFDFNGTTIVEGFRREALDPNRAAPDPLVGRWRCSHELMVEIRADGTALHTGNVAGKWKPVATQTTERKYQISWKDGLTVDAVILETSLKKYKAQNNAGFKYTAERVEE